MIDMQGKMELALGGNGSRPFKYKINIVMPYLVNLYLENITDGNINTLCKSTQIPGVKVNTRDFHRFGHSYKLPTIKTFDTEWSATFYLDDAYAVRVALDKWISAIDQYNSQGLNDYDDTTSLMTKIEKKIDAGGSMLKKLLTTKNPLASTPTDFPSVTGEIQITQINVVGYDTVTYVLHDAFPISLSQIQFDDAKTDSISDFTASFAFSHYTIEFPSMLDSFASNIG